MGWTSQMTSGSGCILASPTVDGRCGPPTNMENFEGFLKYRILEQTQDDHVPLALTAFSNVALSAVAREVIERNTDRLTYHSSLIIARKFSPASRLLPVEVSFIATLLRMAILRICSVFRPVFAGDSPKAHPFSPITRTPSAAKNFCRIIRM